jgi:hypothetical protein
MTRVSAVSQAEKLLGSWRADMARWATGEPEVDSVPKSVVELVIGRLEVHIYSRDLRIVNYGSPGRVQEGPYSIIEDGERLLLRATMRKNGKRGLFEARFIDDDHLDLVLISPRKDFMALKRVTVGGIKLQVD